MEGRDIGSVVFPGRGAENFSYRFPGSARGAPLAGASAKGRRYFDLERTLEEMHERDRRDRERTTSPLVRAADAVVVDSTAMEPEEVARLVVMLARNAKRRGSRRPN